MCVPPEREVPPAHRARDAEAEGAGRGAQCGAEGVEGEATSQEEGEGSATGLQISTVFVQISPAVLDVKPP